jgi:CheY-like chemotaxis protein
MRVLLADDEDEIIRALRLVLEKSKYSVDAVHTGTEALDYIRRTVYDAVVLDIMMPGMDGLEVLRSARAEKITTPVMLLTARSDIGDRVAGLEAGGGRLSAEAFCRQRVSGQGEGPVQAQRRLRGPAADRWRDQPGLPQIRAFGLQRDDEAQQ